MSERALYVTGTNVVFGVFHPGDGSASAVLFCPPFGWDEICSYRSRRAWAERLSARGHPSLRFDLPGTGDSPGFANGPHRLEEWVAAVETAAAWLRRASGRERTTAIGIGLGGLLALRAVALGAPIDDLVLWGVPADGKRLLRELRAVARVESESIVAAGGPAPPVGEPLAPGGFVVSEELQADLAALDAAALRIPVGRSLRVLLIGRDGVRLDESLRRQLEESASEVSTDPGYGYGAMMSPPDSSRLPVEVFATVDSWLAGRSGEQRESQADAAPTDSDSVEVAVDGALVRETPVRIDAGTMSLFGILAEPALAPAGTFAVVLLNAGAIRRVGPNRMWVDFARRWAARGITTFRVDVEGIGDATGDGQRYTDVSELYEPSFVAQVQLALDRLSDLRGVERFILLGLCSGAFWSFHTALEDPRVAAAIMLNPRVLHWHPRLDAARDARTLGTRVQTWRFWQWNLPRGRATLPRLLSLGRWVATTVVRPFDRPVAKTLAQTAESLERLQSRGQTATLIFCEGEPLREELLGAELLPRGSRWPNLEFELLPGRDHTFRPVWMHQRVHEAVDRALERELGRPEPTAATGAGQAATGR